MNSKILLIIILSFIVQQGNSSQAFIPNEISIRQDIEDSVEFYFENEKFDKLESIANQYRDNEERTYSGLWKINFYYKAFRDYKYGVGEKENKVYIDKIIDKWMRIYPNSPTPIIVKGKFLSKYAWSIRGNEWAKDVPDEAWKPFKEKLELAKKFMLANKKIASRDPNWYLITARILRGLSTNKVAYRKFIDEGLDKFPYYYPLFFEMGTYLFPKWHGSHLEFEKFALDSVERSKAKEGFGMYARLYWFLSQTYSDRNIFSESHVVWEKMRQGIFDVLKHYPDSWNLQNFAHFACLARDRKTTRVLINRLSKPVIVLDDAWINRGNYSKCYKYAFSKSIFRFLGGPEFIQ